VLVECGFVRVRAGDGSEFTFTPSLGRIAALGSPQEIVQIFAALHGADAAAQAAYVLACLCDQEDPTPLIGGWDVGLLQPETPLWQPIVGLMPQGEQILIARHLMRHGIVGIAAPGSVEGEYGDRFDASDYVSAASVHLGLSSADAEALSMTEFQRKLRMKYPQKAGRGADDIPSREEYEEHMRRHDEKVRARQQAESAAEVQRG
jgi:hypothetical protein